MRTSKKYLAILLTLCTLLCSIVSYSIYAVTVKEETPISADADLGNEGELMPMAASSCSPYVRYDSAGNVYSVTFYDASGRVSARIDYQGAAHWIDGAYRLPHQHNYTYHYGPNGEISRTDSPTYTNFRPW